ncbi:MAG: aldehyde dehydrogenase family protein, partial [Acidimicrobiia bacterium]|nr:aldehyde dehydrogenase family protein [Acidimicrobiia bacterium]
MSTDQLLDRRNFYINGKWVAPTEARDAEVINPSTEQPCAVISFGSKADTDAAVAAARAAFVPWAETPVAERVALLKALLERYQARAEEMAEAISLEMGAPIDLARTAQVGAGLGHIKSIIRAVENFEFDQPLGDHAPDNRILYEPVGVCALITPWNWPMNQVTLKVVPALGAGCTMVLKPSEEAPLSSMLFAEMIDEAGFPAGVFNLVNGDGAGVGTQLSGHPDVDMVSFTGSTRAGVAISKNAADSIKRVALELGGKGANIIFDDADEKAVTWGVRRCFNNSGQSCNAPTRMLVQRSVYDKAVESAAAAAEQTAVDIASHQGAHIGPVVNERQFNKIQGLIQTGIDEGARLVVGGTGRPEGHDSGYFVRPTVFADVTPEMTIAKEEIFGPVLSIMPFDTEEEAVAIANDTAYGLTNYVQTTDAERARRVARRLRSGM